LQSEQAQQINNQS